MTAAALTQVTEKAWQAQVRELLALAGFDLTYCTWNSRRSPAGFPDLVALRSSDGTLAVLELKTETGRLSPAQVEWLGAWSIFSLRAELAGLRVIVGMFRPSDRDQLWELLDGGNTP